MMRMVSLLATVLLTSTAWANDFSSCFIPGEVIEYKIYWMGIPLAWSTTSTDSVTEDGRTLIRIKMVTQTYNTFKHIYRVDDVTEVLIDPKTALPVRHDLVLNEGSVHKSQLTTFHHDQKMAIFQNRLSNGIMSIPIETNTQEIISFVYSNRNEDIRDLAAQEHKLLVDGKVYALGIRIWENDDIDLSDYGKVPSIQIEPLAAFDGLFLRQGKVFFWVSKQKAGVVTYMKAKVAVGGIAAKLQRVSGPSDGFWNKKEEWSVHE